jgi:hypothetical protein
MVQPILLDLHHGQRPARDDDARKAGHVPEDECVDRIPVCPFVEGTNPQSWG